MIRRNIFSRTDQNKKHESGNADDDNGSDVMSGNETGSDTIHESDYLTYTILDKDILQNCIPSTAQEQRQKMSESMIEWRWRFYNINQRKMVEISYYDGEKRIYTDYNGNEIEYDENELKSWEQFIVKTLYAYVEN